MIHRFVVAGLEAYNAPEEKLDPTRIVPVIKDTAWLEETRQATVARGIDKPLESVHEDFAPGLVVLYAQDSPKTIRYLTPKDVQEAGLDRGRLRRLAVENLGKVLPQIQFRGTNGLYMVIAGGDYETSLLLVDSFWTNGRVQVKGDYVVSIPARGLLFVTGSADPEGVRRLKSVTEEALKQSSYRLTSDLFVYRGGKFQAFQPSVP